MWNFIGNAVMAGWNGLVGFIKAEELRRTDFWFICFWIAVAVIVSLAFFLWRNHRKSK